MALSYDISTHGTEEILVPCTCFLLSKHSISPISNTYPFPVPLFCKGSAPSLAYPYYYVVATFFTCIIFDEYKHFIWLWSHGSPNITMCRFQLRCYGKLGKLVGMKDDLLLCWKSQSSWVEIATIHNHVVNMSLLCHINMTQHELDQYNASMAHHCLIYISMNSTKKYNLRTFFFPKEKIICKNTQLECQVAIDC